MHSADRLTAAMLPYLEWQPGRARGCRGGHAQKSELFSSVCINRRCGHDIRLLTVLMRSLQDVDACCVPLTEKNNTTLAASTLKRASRHGYQLAT
jgi:hypothetical protein